MFLWRKGFVTAVDSRSIWKRSEEDSMVLSWWIFLALFLSGVYCSQQGKVESYCQWEVFNATCPGDRVVVMETAMYGRMALGRCVETEFHIGCQDSVLPLADSRCSGRHFCTISVPDPKMHKRVPCLQDLMAYLQASYTCLPVSLPKSQSDICAHGYELQLTNPAGLLASIITETQGFGGAQCPWTIRILPGQRINLTHSNVHDTQYCQVYATVRERGARRDTAVCGGTQRERVVYISQGNEVDVSLVRTSTSDDQGYFLIKYEAVSCPDMEPPSGGYVRRSGDQLVVSCNHTSHSWHLVCQGTQWVGDIRNCTDDMWPSGSPGKSLGLLPPYGLLAAVLIGVVLGICIGLALLAAVMCCFRKMTVTAVTYRQPAQEATEMTEQVSQAFGGPEYGYTHVWEMRSHPSLPYGEPNVHKLSDDKTITMTKSTACPRTLHSDHVYESPKLEKHRMDTLPGPVYHEFDSDAEKIQNIHDKVTDVMLKDNGDEPLATIHPRGTGKPRGYRPVPIEAASPKLPEKIPGHNT